MYFRLFFLRKSKTDAHLMGYRHTRAPGSILPMQSTFGRRNEFPVAFKTGKNKKKSIARNYVRTTFIALDKLGNSFLIYVGLFLYTQVRIIRYIFGKSKSVFRYARSTKSPTR